MPLRFMNIKVTFPFIWTTLTALSTYIVSALSLVYFE